MSASLLVLLVGAAAGLVLALLMARRRSPAGPPDAGSAGEERAVIEERRRQIYEALREARSAGDAETVAELEHEAALVLRDLERLGAATPVPAAVASSPEAPVRTPAWIGFLAGLTVAALLVGLYHCAAREAGPRRDGMVAGAVGEGGQPHPEALELSPQDRAELAALEEAVAANPEDLGPRKRYAQALLGTGQLFAAFQQADEILARDSQDLDGLYVTAVVRLEMGQEEVAGELFDRVLARQPDHFPSLVGKGLALARGGDPAAARALWEQAAAALSGDARGADEQIQRLLAALADEEAGGGPGAADSTGGSADAAVAAEDGYRVRLELAPGATVPPGAVLFISLHGASPGPPAAVRRIETPSFPLEVRLGEADSMLGRPLPGEGTLRARLDLDGNATTQETGAARADAPARRGTPVHLVLGP